MQNSQGQRMKWSEEYNIAIMRSYFRITCLETNKTAYRQYLHQDFVTRFPYLSHITEQRVADQRRSIVKNKLLSMQKIEDIKIEIASELQSINQKQIGSQSEINFVNITRKINEQVENLEDYTDISTSGCRIVNITPLIVSQ